MRNCNFPKPANQAAMLAGLLAVTTFLACPGQLRAQSADATGSVHTFVPSTSRVTLDRHMPARVLDGTAVRVGHYNPEQKLRLALAIQAPHMAEEEQFIKELITKGSPNFHKFLTQDEWNARFAPAAEDEQAVVDWAQSQGLTVTKRYANRLLVDVEAPSAVIEKVFGVTINNYQVGDEVEFSNDRNPMIPANLSGILHTVLGLSSVERFHRIGTSKRMVKGPDYVAGPVVAEGGSLHLDGDPTKAPANRAEAMASKPTPLDIFPLDGGVADPDNIQSSEGYDYNALQRLSHCCNEPGAAGGSPPESSIALVGYGNFNASDVSTFFGYYGMAANIYAYWVNGTGFPGQDGEAPLDVEYSGAMANSYGSWVDTAAIYEYEMPNNLYATYADAFNNIVSDDHAKVVSTSYGWEENNGFSGSVATGTMHPIFNSMTGTGWTLIASAGDNGATDGCNVATAVDYPASDSDFLAAGGTELLLDSSGAFVSENAWTGDGSCGSNHGGGGGGVSTLFVWPSWQTSLTPYYEWNGSGEWVVSGSNGRRMPDISLTANPDVMGEWYYAGGSWQNEGGTSIVAPELAGFFAQENSYLDYIGNKCGSGSSACSPVGLANPFFYEDAISGAPHNPFYDTTSGCNSNQITAANPSLMYFCAASGFDLATGWGSANMLQLAWGINWELIPAYGNPSLAFTGPATGVWYNSNQQVNWTLSDAGSSGFPAPGVAGFTQGWDTIPADPGSEPHGGTGNSFYSGPQYPFASGGCLAFEPNGCAGGVSQGCHTVQVEGWDNQGRTTYGSYGPLCYDTVAPSIKVTNSPVQPASGWWDTPVTVTLHPADPGGSNASGIFWTLYSIDSPNCYPGVYTSCYLYTGPFTISAQGQHYIYYWTEDNAGNVSAEPYEWVSLDLTAPSTTSTLSGNLVGGAYYSNVQVALHATDTGGSGVKTTYYSLDGGGNTVYTGYAFTVSSVGGHSVVYWSVDSAGNVESAHTITFTNAAATAATLTAPAPGTTLVGPNVPFSWTTASGATGYSLWLGSTGVGSNNLYHSGETTATSVTAGLPTNGETVYARLYTTTGTVTLFHDYTYTAAAQAVLMTPTPSTVLAGPTVTFSWTAGTGNTTGYSLWLGTAVGTNNLYHSGAVTATSVTAGGLPTNGETVYARLFTYINGVTEHADYTYTAAAQAVMTTPAPSTVLAGPTMTFSWTAGTGNTTGYSLWLGS
ncbi:MAG: protease pro-enzyme activation domain-containing protein, partial [Terracidiphilus sp.]|nr:protease pro-enzyme activation domain-containing protein [Terracidiphilus sp.]